MSWFSSKFAELRENDFFLCEIAYFLFRLIYLLLKVFKTMSNQDSLCFNSKSPFIEVCLVKYHSFTLGEKLKEFKIKILSQSVKNESYRKLIECTTYCFLSLLVGSYITRSANKIFNVLIAAFVFVSLSILCYFVLVLFISHDAITEVQSFLFASATFVGFSGGQSIIDLCAYQLNEFNVSKGLTTTRRVINKHFIPIGSSAVICTIVFIAIFHVKRRNSDRILEISMVILLGLLITGATVLWRNWKKENQNTAAPAVQTSDTSANEESDNGHDVVLDMPSDTVIDEKANEKIPVEKVSFWKSESKMLQTLNVYTRKREKHTKRQMQLYLIVLFIQYMTISATYDLQFKFWQIHSIFEITELIFIFEVHRMLSTILSSAIYELFMHQYPVPHWAIICIAVFGNILSSALRLFWKDSIPRLIFSVFIGAFSTSAIGSIRKELPKLVNADEVTQILAISYSVQGFAPMVTAFVYLSVFSLLDPFTGVPIIVLCANCAAAGCIAVVIGFDYLRSATN